MAYQTAGHGADVQGAPAEMVRETSRWATRGLEPDRALLLDIPVGETAVRLDRELDRIESRGAAYRAAVAEVYRDVFSGNHARFRIVDAAGTRDEVEARVWEAVRDVVED